MSLSGYKVVAGLSVSDTECAREPYEGKLGLSVAIDSGDNVAYRCAEGAPHHGPDTPDNILCLCPNHHVLLDHGGVGIGEDLSLVGEEGRLEVGPRHRVCGKHLRYRREHHRT